MTMMRAARLHEIGGNFQLDELEVPQPRPHDVLVKVRATGVVPNLRNVITHYAEWFPFMPLPKLPAIYGLDAAGEVVAVGDQVGPGIQPGDRVYMNPGLSCGSCPACLRNEASNCPAFTFHGYFGFGPGSQQVFKNYPYGGFGQYLVAPPSSLVKLPDSVSYEQAARLGYIGTAFSALKKAVFTPGQTVLIDGGTGTLGIGGVISALALGAKTIFASGRNEALLDRLAAVAPDRILPIVLGRRPTSEIVMEATGGYGVDVMLQCLGANAPADAVLDSFIALRRGGKAVNIGGVAEPIAIDPFPLMALQKSLIGSCWFSTDEGRQMVALADTGLLKLDIFNHRRFALDQVNEALVAAEDRSGGFNNVVIMQD
jgi:threonine dehydrogenase-like Zn-dependent dehydrogenase